MPPRRQPSKLVEVDSRDASLICHALAQRLKEAKNTLDLLKIAKDRELNRLEKSMLPGQFIHATRETLIENIDPWISLIDDINYLLDDFNPDEIKEGERYYTPQKKHIVHIRMSADNLVDLEEPLNKAIDFIKNGKSPMVSSFTSWADTVEVAYPVQEDKFDGRVAIIYSYDDRIEKPQLAE